MVCRPVLALGMVLVLEYSAKAKSGASEFSQTPGLASTPLYKRL